MSLSQWASGIFKKGSSIVQSGVENITQLGKDVVAAAEDGANAVKSGLDELREQGETFKQEVNDALAGEGSLQDRLVDLGKAGENALSGAAEALDQTGQSLKEAGESLLSKGKDRVEQGMEDLRTVGLEALEDTKTMFSDGAALVKEGVARIENDANSWLSGVYETISDGIRTVDDNFILPSAHVALLDETDTAQEERVLIALSYLDGKNLQDMAWNAGLTQLGINKLGLSASGRDGGLVCNMDATGRVLEIQDEQGAAILTLTLLAPGEQGNEAGKDWAVLFEQSHGLAHPLGTLAHNDALLLPLFADSISPAGLHVPNAIGIALTDDGPKPQFSSNFLILDALGSELLGEMNGVTGGSLGEFLHRAAFDQDGKLDFTLDNMLDEIRAASENALSGALSLENDAALKDLVSVLIDRDLGQGIKDFIQNNILMILVPQATKDGLCDTVDEWLNYNDTRRPVEGIADSSGMLNADFGLDGPATGHTRPTGWELLHGGAVPAPVGWSVSGVQAMFDLMHIRASQYQDTRLALSAAPGDNCYPPQKLVAMAGDVEVMSLAIEESAPGQYGYVIHQNTGLCHDQDSLINGLLGLVGNSGDYDSQLAGLVDMIMEGLESALGSFSGLILGALDTDLRTLLEETLTVEHLVNTFSTDNLLYLPLPYITMDGDGDVTANLAFHAVKDSVPLVEGLPAALVVAEADLDGFPYAGSDAAHMVDNAGRPGSDESQAQGALIVDAFDGIGAISIGEAVVWQNGQSLGPVAGKYGSMTVTDVTDMGGGRYQVQYSYTLERALEHEEPAWQADNNRQPADPDGEEFFLFTITDGDGDQAQAAVAVEIVDDVPHPLNIVSDQTPERIELAEEGVSGPGVSGSLALNYGADGPSGDGGKPSFQIGLRPAGNGEIDYRSGADGGRIMVEGKYGDLYIDPASGEYQYVLDRERVDSAEPGGRYETLLTPKEFDLRASGVTPQSLTGVLYESIEAFKAKSYNDDMVREGLNGGKFTSWRNSGKATVSKTNDGFGVAGRAGGLLTSDGDKIGFGLSGLTLVHEAVLVHLSAPVTSLDIRFGDVGGTDVGKVFMYDADGGYLGMRSFGANSEIHDGISIQAGDFDAAVKSFFVVPQTGNFTIQSVTVPEEQEVWVPDSGDDLRLTEDFSYILTDSDGDSAGGNLKLDLGNPDDIDFQAGVTIHGDETDAVLVGTEYDDTLFGGSGNEVIIGAGGNNQLWGGDGADTFAWDSSALSYGRDSIMDFSTTEGDRLDFGALLDESGSLDVFLESRVTGAELDVDAGLLSFTLEAEGNSREISIHFTGDQTRDYTDFVQVYSEAGHEEQAQLALALIRSLCA